MSKQWHCCIIPRITRRHAIVPRRQKRRLSRANSNFVFFFVHDSILREKECRLNGVFFNEILQTGIRDPTRGKGYDETSRRGGVPVKCFQTRLQYNNNTTYNFI